MPMHRCLGIDCEGSEGATMVEYGLMLALIAGIALAAVPFFGQAVLALFLAAVAAGL